jgi:hypothetical protein
MRKITIEENWHQQSEAAKIEAQSLPHGKERNKKGPPARNRLPNQSMAVIAGAQATGINDTA